MNKNLLLWRHLVSHRPENMVAKLDLWAKCVNIYKNHAFY